MRVRLHSFNDKHHFSGKVEKTHVTMAVAYAMGGSFHIEFLLSIAYFLCAGLIFFAHKELD